RGTAFDLSTRPPSDEFKNSGGVNRDIRLRASDLRRFFRLPHLTGPALTLLVSARRENNEAILAGTADEFAALSRCVTLEIAGADGSVSGVDRLVDLHRGLSWAAGQASDLSYPVQAAELMISEAAQSPRLTRLPASGAPDGGHCVHVQLLDIEPPIWRRLELPSRMPLADLHSVLVLVMGWANYHLHVFEQGERSFGLPHPEDHVEVEDSRTVLLGELLPREGDSLVYEYDFGDSWRHEIRVESISASPPERPRLLDGARACPPEDCGGPPGHERLLAALGDPHHPDHEELSDWAGDDFDPEVFHLGEHDLLLERLDAAWHRAKKRTPQRT
ncbi:MAG: plasmid pRiA4b ORF-3 family protein, partial [Planctomycetota bacterium]